VQRVPVYVEGQVQVPGLEQVPPFEQTGEQIAEKMNSKSNELKMLTVTYVCCN